MRTLPWACAALAAALVFPQFAQANLLQNGSLETTTAVNQFNMVVCTPTTNATALTNWTVGGCIDIVPTSYFTPSLGNYSVDLIGTPGLGSISQTVATQVGHDYLLTFDLSFNPDTLTNEENDTRFTKVSAIGATTQSQTYTNTLHARTANNMMWVTKVFTFTADSTSTTIKLEALMPTGLPSSFSPTNVYSGSVVDNLDLELVGQPQGGDTPEPASLGVLGLGSLMMLKRRRK